MNNNINTFDSFRQYSDAYKNISSPSISYVKDSGKIVYSPDVHEPTSDKTKARVGDLVFYNDMVEPIDTVLYVDYRDTSLVTYLMENCVCYGIVVIDVQHAHSGSVVIVSLDYMNNNDPIHGSTTARGMTWGDAKTVANVCTSNQITGYLPGTTTQASNGDGYCSVMHPFAKRMNNVYNKDPYVGTWRFNSGALCVTSPYDPYNKTNEHFAVGGILAEEADVDDDPGGYNTESIMHDVGKITEADIKNNNTKYKAVGCCNLYYSDDDYVTKKSVYGRYYLPSITELMYLAARLEIIDNARRAVGRDSLTNKYYWSSSQYNSNGAWKLDLGFSRAPGYCDYGAKSISNHKVLAFVAF